MIMLKLWNVRGFWGTLGLGVGEGSLYSMVPKHGRSTIPRHICLYLLT